MHIIIELLHDDARTPERATSGSAGYDLFAYTHDRDVRCSDGTRQWTTHTALRDGKWILEIPPATAVLVPLGFRARLPEGFEAQIRPRSGTSFKRGLQIPNSPGTVDADFPDEWMVPMRNPLPHAVVVEHGERIAQMVLARYEVLSFEPGIVQRTTERAGGFGSTGA